MDLWQCYMYTLLDSLKWNYSPAYKILCILLQVPLLCMGSLVWQGAFCAQEYLFLDWTKVDSSLLKHLESSQIWSHNVSEALHVVVLYNFTLLSEICGKLFGMKICQGNKPQQWIWPAFKEQCSFPLVFTLGGMLPTHDCEQQVIFWELCGNMFDFSCCWFEFATEEQSQFTTELHPQSRWRLHNNSLEEYNYNVMVFLRQQLVVCFPKK